MGDSRAAARLFEAGNTAGGENGLVDLAELIGIPKELVPPVAVNPSDAASALAAVKALRDNVATGAANEIVLEDTAGVEERLNRIITFLETQVSSGNPVDGTRLGTVCVALSQIGQVSADESTPAADGTGKTRVGANRLDEYFSVAFGNGYTAALKTTVQKPNADLVSWCGIFAVWAIKCAGVECRNWKLGDGIGMILRQTQDPVAGDVAFLHGKGMHMCIVIDTSGGKLVSIDGNTNAAGAASGGEVGVKERPISAVHSYYSQSLPRAN